MINVPPGARPGDQLAIPLQDGTSLTITVPEGSKPGDSLRFSKGGSQTAPPKTPAPAETVTVTVPAGARAGDQLSIPLPDGSEVTITLPQGARPGDDLEIPTGGARTAAPPKAPKRPGPIAAASNAPAQRVKQADCVTPGGTIMINVPPGARPGDQLAIPLQDGTSLTITVPEGSKPGDSLRFSTGGSQTAAPPPKTPDTVEVTVPPGARPGDELSIPLPDGTSIKITVPPGARPGDDLEIPTAGGAPAPTVDDGAAADAAFGCGMMDVGCGLAGAPADVESHPDWTVTGTPGPGTAGSPRSLSVRVPENARAGDTMRIYHGVTGEVFSCAVPPGGEGQTLLVPI